MSNELVVAKDNRLTKEEIKLFKRWEALSNKIKLTPKEKQRLLYLEKCLFGG